ncbi:hypothetical protein EPUS_01444 [Endocarpon pusillum Z07020]|uniref:GRIP-related Arf-binding domain-containing protein n=1 Tax=Endocarpon pusillum (strain Z07020 / HMAS-L-300199) TaxID=1263415 RepID=U1GVM3_ENDPU|nr:uncharacterized protein EPUS_01444 [Endocarpon pusillum Z07020]ERF76111.1 hypothetical protein EPUS_01444 [Endocarpon pusillum Z07020]
MSGNTTADPLAHTSLGSKSAKKRRKKGATDKANGDVKAASTTSEATEVPTKMIEAEDEEPQPEEVDQDQDQDQDQSQLSPITVTDNSSTTPLTNGTQKTSMTGSTEDSDARFEALVKDRDALRIEVTQLRQSLEELQANHQTSLGCVQQELRETRTEKENAEEQYQTLLGRVNTIKAQLGERLKADAEDLAQARSRIEELEEQNNSLQEQQNIHSAELENLTSEIQAQSKELSSLRNRATLSQQNWLKEREDLIEQESYAREQYQNAEQAMREWEVLALEERSIRKDLGEKVGDLEEQLSGLKEAYERAAGERDSQSNTVDGLQKALQEIQTARKRELREVVESSQSEAEKLRSQLAEAQQASASATQELETVKKELERALPFEKEVKEKNLLIGKLRHEAVTLNEHLTKALRFLKKGKPEDNVDRQIVTNHLLHFLALDRPSAGLARPSSTTTTTTTTFSSNTLTGSLRLPHSPLVHRTPSTPALTGDYFPDGVPGSGVGSPSSRESLAELWQGFLEQESGAAAKGKSRTGSLADSSPR